jgi:menaquinone-dependent protoporphyrinogen IX oxidase
MKALVVYESMFGNTRRIAESIAQGLGEFADVRTVCVAAKPAPEVQGVDLVVVGGPTHAWSMTRAQTRQTAPGYANKPGSGLRLEPGADEAQGVREWLHSLPDMSVAAAAFDTRINKPAIFTGRASKAIARSLTKHGARLMTRPESFLVDPKSHLLPGEDERGRLWGLQLAKSTAAALTQAGS